MATINPLVDLSAEPITRQTLQSMWDGSLSTIAQADLSDDFLITQSGTDFSDAPTSPVPGTLFFHKAENVMYCWHDEIDGTGVSLWLAIGPDKFETACLTNQPVEAAGPVDLVYDRVVAPATANLQSPPWVLGFNQSGVHNPITINDGPTYGGVTAASGTWIRVGVDGLVYGKQNQPSSHESSGLVGLTQAEPLALEHDAAKQMSLISTAGGIHSKADGWVGLSTQWLVNEATNTPFTEPANIFKFIYSPRYGNGAVM